MKRNQSTLELYAMVSLVFESIVGYAFWSLFHAVGPMIWFYPLNELELTGYELFVLVVFTPVLWLSGKLADNVLRTKLFQIIAMIVMIVGILSFQADKTLQRLIILHIGVGAAFLLKSSTWWSKDPLQCRKSFWGYTIGYFMLLSSRIWYKSITPMWNDKYSNRFISTVFSMIVIATMISYLEHMKHVQKVFNLKGRYRKPKEIYRNRSSVVCSVAYGCMCFLMHTFLGEVSVLSRYTVTGVGVSSPAPNPWGGCVLLAALSGLLLSLYSTLSSNRMWLASGVLSSMGLMFLQSWYAFASGLLFVVYLMSVWPTVAENVINCRNPGKCLFWANLVYLVGIFGMVWCTAYNFVPFGGELARERTYIIILMASSFVSLSLMKNYKVTVPIRIKLSLPPSYTSPTPPPSNSKQDKRVKNAIFFIVLLGLVGFNFRSRQIPKPNINPEIQQRGQFSALIWTFHFGYDNDGWPSFERAAQVLNDTGADVITLLESDASKPYLGNNDIAMWLGERLGMYVDFGPSTRDHTWGTTLLSKYPIVKSEHHLLPSPKGELAPAISATINMTGNLVNFVVTHMGNDRDNLDRKLQAQRLAELADQSEHPVVFLGYVTSAPGSRDYRQLLKKGRLRDIDSTDRDRWCQYIMYRDLKRLGYARISHNRLSDTELQMAKWQFYGDGPKVDNNAIAFPHEKVPKTVQFNKVFGERHEGSWYGTGHHFHGDTPKYFKTI